MSKSMPSQEEIEYILNLFKSNQVKKAHNFIDTLSRDYSDKSLFLNICGAGYASLGQLDIAVQNYKKALSIKPDYAKAHYNLGIALQELGNLDDSVRSYQSAITLEPENAQAYNNLAVVLRELEQLERC